jgi:hypothetical protein
VGTARQGEAGEPPGRRPEAFLALDIPPEAGDQPRETMRQVAPMPVYDATPRLEELAGLPALVVSAASDLVAPPSVGGALAASIPGARYVEIAGVAGDGPGTTGVKMTASSPSPAALALAASLGWSPDVASTGPRPLRGDKSPLRDDESRSRPP